ncbi:ScbA/BarX family gamma-butyrolactone biosynthesis protein [Streptomyces tsukubensis]|uniref:ScbA/BarX family gamma-butyrolactone biosynthesis protein n=1 Tax=Streptomyces tsukubensis TaxID=83656 RepID=UPI0036867CCB
MSASTFRTDRALPGTAGTPGSAAAPPGAGPAPDRPLTSIVPKELVHRTGVAEVMLTGWERVEGDHFTVTAQWPRGHSLFAAGGRYHPLIAAETIRQAGILLAHTEYGVPLDGPLPVEEIRVSTRPGLFGIDWTPATLELRVTVRPRHADDGTLTGLRAETEIRRDGRTAATGYSAVACVTAPRDERPRPRRPDPRAGLPAAAPQAPLPPQAVGRLSPLDVVLSPTPRPDRWLLRTDTGHPVFAGRAGQIPDMVLLEAACQATALTLGRPCTPLDIAAGFGHGTVPAGPYVIGARRLPAAGGTESVLVTGRHFGQPVFHSTVTAAAG